MLQMEDLMVAVGNELTVSWLQASASELLTCGTAAGRFAHIAGLAPPTSETKHMLADAESPPPTSDNAPGPLPEPPMACVSAVTLITTCDPQAVGACHTPSLHGLPNADPRSEAPPLTVLGAATRAECDLRSAVRGWAAEVKQTPLLPAKFVPHAPETPGELSRGGGMRAVLHPPTMLTRNFPDIGSTALAAVPLPWSAHRVASDAERVEATDLARAIAPTATGQEPLHEYVTSRLYAAGSAPEQPTRAAESLKRLDEPSRAPVPVAAVPIMHFNHVLWGPADLSRMVGAPTLKAHAAPALGPNCTNGHVESAMHIVSPKPCGQLPDTPPAAPACLMSPVVPGIPSTDRTPSARADESAVSLTASRGSSATLRALQGAVTPGCLRSHGWTDANTRRAMAGDKYAADGVRAEETVATQRFVPLAVDRMTSQMASTEPDMWTVSLCTGSAVPCSRPAPPFLKNCVSVVCEVTAERCRTGVGRQDDAPAIAGRPATTSECRVPTPKVLSPAPPLRSLLTVAPNSGPLGHCSQELVTSTEDCDAVPVNNVAESTPSTCAPVRCVRQPRFASAHCDPAVGTHGRPESRLVGGDARTIDPSVCPEGDSQGGSSVALISTAETVVASAALTLHSEDFSATRSGRICGCRSHLPAECSALPAECVRNAIAHADQMSGRATSYPTAPPDTLDPLLPRHAMNRADATTHASKVAANPPTEDADHALSPQPSVSQLANLVVILGLVGALGCGSMCLALQLSLVVVKSLALVVLRLNSALMTDSVRGAPAQVNNNGNILRHGTS
jgi:hypothetical protein